MPRNHEGIASILDLSYWLADCLARSERFGMPVSDWLGRDADPTRDRRVLRFSQRLQTVDEV